MGNKWFGVVKFVSLDFIRDCGLAARKNFFFFFFSILCAAVVIAAYTVGAEGPFILDDFENLKPLGFDAANDIDKILRFAFGPDFSEPRRWFSKLSFLLNASDWPESPFYFKLTNVAFHLICGVFLYCLAFQLFSLDEKLKWRNTMAMACAMIWFVSPIHVSTVLYVVQRMTILMTMFCLASLLAYILARLESSYVRRVWLYFVSAAFAFISMSSKENGLLILLYLSLTEWLLAKYRPELESKYGRAICLIFVTIFISIFVFFCVKAYGGYESRSFSIWERLLVQGYIFNVYMLKTIGVIAPTVFNDHFEYLLANGGLVYASVFGWLIHFIVFTLAIGMRGRNPYFFWGVMVFYSGHLIESTALPLELAFDHRNYMPLTGIAVAVISIFSNFLGRLKGQYKAAVLGVCILVVCVMCINTVRYAFIWSNEKILAHFVTETNKSSLRAGMHNAAMLDRIGLPEFAFAELEELDSRFDDYSIDLHMLLVSCREGLSDVDIDSPEESVVFSSGVLHWYEKILKADNVACLNSSVTGGLDALVGFVQNMSGLENKRRYYARFADVSAGYFIKQRNYTKAVEFREIAWEYQPSVATALKLCELFILGGDIKSAKRYLKKAKAIADSSYIKSGSSKKDIEHLDFLLSNIR